MNTVCFNCYICRQQIIMGDKFWGMKVKCNKCGTVLVVPTPGLAERPAVPEQEGKRVVVPDVDQWLQSLHEAMQTQDGKRIVEPSVEPEVAPEPQIGRVGLAVILAGGLIIAAMLMWLFFIRDTWERDNRVELTELASQADDKFTEGHIPDAIKQYEEVIARVAGHKLLDREFAREVSQAQERSKKFRAEETETKRLAEAARQQELAKREDARQKAAVSSWTPSSSSQTDRSWTDDHGNTMTESQEQAAFDTIHRRVQSEQDPYKKAYMEGVEKALTDEREKIRRQRGW